MWVVGEADKLQGKIVSVQSHAQMRTKPEDKLEMRERMNVAKRQKKWNRIGIVIIVTVPQLKSALVVLLHMDTLKPVKRFVCV